MDTGHDITRLARVLRDPPVGLVGRIRSDRVMRLPKPPLKEHALAHPQGGRPPKHRKKSRFANPETRPEAAITTVTDTTNNGKAEAQAWDRVHPRLTHHSARLEHDGEPAAAESTLVRLKVEHLSKQREAPPVWLWSSTTGAAPTDLDPWRQAFLRRFDLEHTYRFEKADPRPDHPEDPYSPDRGPADMARSRRPHPAPPRPAAGRRPPSALGEARQARTPHPGPGPPEVHEHPNPPALPGP